MADRGPPKYFVDETDIGLATILVMANLPVLHPGHPDLPDVPRRTLDVDWIPIVAARDLVVITRDRLSRLAEWEAYREVGLRVIRLAGKKGMTTWGTVRVAADAWDRIERQVADGGAGPWLAIIDGAGTLRVRYHGAPPAGGP